MARKKEGAERAAPSAELLINAAERLIGECGLGRVSLRQISQAANQGNNTAVQYHFQSIEGLIRAILRSRMPRLEAIRAELLAGMRERGELQDVKRLMDVLYTPLFEGGEPPQARHYARFVLALLNSPDGAKYAAEHFDLMPISNHVLDLLHAANPHIPRALIGERQRLIAVMVLSSLFNRQAPYKAVQYDQGSIDNVLNMAIAAILAPVPPSTDAMIVETRT